MSAQKLLIGVLSGLVAGVAIGMLTAPAKGSETRQKISDSAEELKKKMIAAFVRSTQLELYFWESAYHLEKWLIEPLNEKESALQSFF